MMKEQLFTRASRLISMFMAIVLMFSCFAMLPVSAAETADAKADLIVTEVYSVEETVYDGDSVRLYAVIRNNGTADAVNPLVNFAAIGQNVDAVRYNGTIRAGEQKTVISTKEWEAFWGTSKLMARVNSDKAIDEKNYNNNICAQLIPVVDRPDDKPPVTTETPTTEPTTSPTTEPTTPPTTEPTTPPTTEPTTPPTTQPTTPPTTEPTTPPTTEPTTPPTTEPTTLPTTQPTTPPTTEPTTPPTTQPTTPPTTEPTTPPTTQPTTPPTTEPTTPPTTQPTTPAVTEAPKPGPDSTKMIDDFNRADLYGFDIKTANIQAISDYNTVLYGIDGKTSNAANVGNYIGLTATASQNGIYFTDAVLDKNETHKYLVIKIRGAKGGEENYLSLTNEYGVNSNTRKLFKDYVGADGKAVPAITTNWQYIVIDIAKSGMEYYTYGEDMDVIASFRSFRINFSLENVGSEVFIDEMYFADALDGEAVETTEATTQAEYGLPDLVITDITWTPANPITGQGVVFSATVKNQGTRSTNGGVKLGLRFDIDYNGNEAGRTWNDALQEPLKPGESRVLTANGGNGNANQWTAIVGTHKVIAIIDDQGGHAESNENNNVLESNITVTNQQQPTTVPQTTKPTTESTTQPTTDATTEATTQAEYGEADLIVTDITWTPENPSAGDGVVFTATVKNQGTRSTKGGIKIGVRFDIDELHNYMTWNDANQEPLKPGESRVLTANGGRYGTNTWTAVLGTHKVIAFVNDDGKTQTESNTNNNTLEKNITVTQQSSQTTTAPQATTQPSTQPGEKVGNVAAYPQQAGFENAANSGYTVQAGANSTNITTFKTACNNSRTWVGANPPLSSVVVAMFDIMQSGPVTVSVTFPENLNNAVVRPTDKGVSATVNGRTATFVISGAGQYSVEPNGDQSKAVLIFANNYEPAPSGNVQTVAAGTEREGWNWTLNGQTLYIAPGATLNGDVDFYGSGTVCGQGVISGKNKDTWMNAGASVPIEAWQANMTIKNISILNSNCWNIQLGNRSSGTIDNVKIISARPNGDGISVQSSANITIKNCFIRTWDDGIVIKNYHDSNSHDVTVENCVLWTDLAQSMEIGFETNKAAQNGTYNGDPQIYNVTFNNIYVIHANHKAPISIHNGDNAKIHDIKWTNIYVDDIRTGQGDGWNLLVDITNLTGAEIGGAASWTTEYARGSISNITIDGLYVRGGNNDHRMRFDSHTGGSINGVTVKNFYRFGEHITSQGGARADVNSAGVSFQ